VAPGQRIGLRQYPRAGMSSSFGQLFRLTTFGESHGPAVGVVVDGCPPRLPLDLDAVQRDLDRRRPGQSRLVTQRDEADRVEVLSGLFDGRTTGTPLAMLVRNADQRPGAYDHLRDVFRPSHADWTYQAKYGIRDHRGGGRSSARETIGRVAAGAVARQLLATVAGVEVLAWVSEVHGIGAAVDPATVTLDAVEADATRCPDPEAAIRITEAIEAARRDGDSLGGVVTVVARNVPAGLGEPVFDKLDADLAGALLSLPAAKGFEIGSGFAGTLLTGRQHNDPFEPGAGGRPRTRTNHSGGVQGGISNGEPIWCRVAFKPTATISSEQDTVTTAGQATTLAARGRHDPCVLPRAVPLVEAMVLLVLADHWLRQQALDVLPRSG
jgi:chorismate synthase